MSDKANRKKALVTGAAGFLGRYCAQEISRQGYEVTGLDLTPFVNFKDWGISCYHQTACDLHNLNSLSTSGLPDLILHCAGSGSVPASFQYPHHDFHSNVVTTMEILEFCRLNNSIHLAIPSSAAVYGVVGKMPITEETNLAPVSPYGVHKKIIEDLARSYATSFNVKSSIVRYFSLYGTNLRKQILWDACNKAMQDDFKFSGNGDEIRDFLHVTDAARLLILAGEHASIDCPIVNGGTGHGSSIKEILEIVGSSWTPNKTPKFSGTTRIGDPANYIASINKIQAWGFTATNDLKTEIHNYVEWFRQDKGL